MRVLIALIMTPFFFFYWRQQGGDSLDNMQYIRSKVAYGL
jgi:hypothetical protein